MCISLGSPNDGLNAIQQIDHYPGATGFGFVNICPMDCKLSKRQ